VQTHRFSWAPVLYALPVALLVDAILHGNNIRDIENDRQVHINTVPILIGSANAKLMYHGLVFGAYALVPILMLFAGLPWLSILTFLSLPLAVNLSRMVQSKEQIPESQFAMIDAATAQLHSIFGLLLIVSLIIHYFVFG
jgi:1,4-dihydroxy-2-naphthoate octaprenyltransferase